MFNTESLVVLAAIVGGWLVIYYLKEKGILAGLEKRGFKIEPLGFMYRTKIFNDFIERIGEKYSRIWRILSLIGVIISIYAMLLGIYFFHVNIINYFTKPEVFSPLTPVIPGVTIGLRALPYFIVAVVTVFFSHELAHAFTAVSEGIPVKSSGVFFFIIFFGAFVELDDDIMEKAKLTSKIKVLSAGSAANFVIFYITLLLLTNLFIPYGVRISGTLEGYPAHGVLKDGDIIVSVNGTRVRSISEYMVVTANMKPGDVIELTVERNGKRLTILLKMVESPKNSSKGFIGVWMENYLILKGFSNLNHKIVFSLYEVTWWIMVLNASVAVFNMLPVFVFDGALILSEILKKVLKEGIAKTIQLALSTYFLAVILLNMLLTFMLPFPALRIP